MLSNPDLARSSRGPNGGWLWDILRRTIVPVAWAVMRRLPGGVRFWIWCLKALHIPPRSTQPGDVPVRVHLELQPDKVAFVQTPEFYGLNYFDKHKDILVESGYDVYQPRTDQTEVAHAVKSIFRAERVLDVGCAKGFMVNSLRQSGLDAWGVDFSEYAISHALPSVREYVRVGDVRALDFPSDSFDLVLSFDTLEHLNVENIVRAIRELKRVTADKVWISVPCLGINDYGPPPAGHRAKFGNLSYPCTNPTRISPILPCLSISRST